MSCGVLPVSNTAGASSSAPYRNSTDAPENSDGADRAGEHAGVTDLLQRLAADRREAFVLTQVLGLSYAEADEVAGCPVGTIRSPVRARTWWRRATRVRLPDSGDRWGLCAGRP